MADDTSPTQEAAPAPPPATPPETKTEPAPAPVAPAADPAPSGPIVAEYTAESGRTYHFPGAPQSAVRGDVCALPYLPDDGCWQPSAGPVTRLPDNHADNQPSGPDWDLVATSVAEHEAILARLAEAEGSAQ